MFEVVLIIKEDCGTGSSIASCIISHGVGESVDTGTSGLGKVIKLMGVVKRV